MNKVKFNKVLVLILALVLSVSLIACGDKDTNEEEADVKGDSEFLIGFASSGLNHPFQITLKDGVVEAAEEQGVEVIVVDGQDDPTKQISSIEDLIQQGIDLLIVNPVDGDAIVPAIEAANKEDIPVITVDRGANGGEILTHIESDSILGGKLAAEFIAEKIGEAGEVVEIEGQTGVSSTRDRGKGFHDGVDEFDDIEIVFSQPADWDKNKAMTTMENALQSHPDIKGIFAHNDEMALGAARAIESAGLKDEIIVVGFDAIDEAVEAVKAGDMDATVEQQPDLMGRTALEKAIEYLKDGKELDKLIPVEIRLVTE